MFYARIAIIGLGVLLLAACGGSGDGGKAPSDTPVVTNPPTTNDFSLSVPAGYAMAQGETTTLTVGIDRTGSPGEVDLSLSGPPLLSTAAAVDRIGYLLVPTDSGAELHLDVGMQVPAATYALRLTGKAGELTRTATLMLTVTDNEVTAGYWEEIPNSHMRDVCPRDFHFGPSDCQQVLGAWGGAAWDVDHARMFFFGGGHTDYYGNEVYEFRMADRAWYRLTDPYQPKEGDEDRCVESFDGGQTPTARHSYWEQAWVPQRHVMIQHGGGYSCTGGGSGNGTWSFDPAKATGGYSGAVAAWDYLEKHDDTHHSSAPGGPLVWHPETKTLYDVGKNSLYKFDFDDNRWVKLGNTDWGVYLEYFTVALDTTRERVWAVGTDYGSDDFSVYYLDLRQPPYKMVKVTTDWPGEKPVLRAPGIAYDSTRDELVMWCPGDSRCNAASGDAAQAEQARRVYVLDPEKLTWRIDTPDTGPAWTDRSRGIYDKWQYYPAADVFIGVYDADENVWLYHPPNSRN